MSKWHLEPISQADAEREPQAQRLSFERRPPSWATRQALAKADKHAPPIDTQRVKTGQRPRGAS